MKLAGKTVIVTGASEGLGKTIAEECVREGANVVICARRADFLKSALADLTKVASEGQVIRGESLDISDSGSAKKLVDLARQLPTFTGIVNNAGVYGPIGAIEQVNIDEWEESVRINVFGLVRLCREAASTFKARQYGKIVNLSGGGATNPMPRFTAYATSKAAVVRFTESLALELKPFKIDVNSVAPGALNTRLLHDVLAAGPERAGTEFYERSVKQAESGGAPLEKAAALVTFLLSSESDGISGRLISALWDQWKQFPSRKQEIEKSDVYTLRRITAKDRGYAWDS